MASDAERRLLAEQKKLDALRERIVGVTYMKAPEVRRHLNRTDLDTIPPEVLPWVPSPGKRVERRYHPADVAAYPARARRWHDARTAGREAEVLEEMRRELEERDRQMIADALKVPA
jgi:hypothetical protein